MKKSRFSESQIIRILKEADGGQSGPGCLRHGQHREVIFYWFSMRGRTMSDEFFLKICQNHRLHVPPPPESEFHVMRISVQGN